jgi:hypothetical protein
MTEILLGRTAKNDDVRLPIQSFLRHAVCLGNAGSGKTVTCKVLCEEFIRNGVPVIAVDPQGDIASLGLPASEEDVKGHGTAPEIRQQFADKVELVVWTPGSTLGVPLSVNPLAAVSSAVDGMAAEELLQERTFAAQALAEIASFDAGSSEGRTIVALFGLVMEHAAQAGQRLGGVAALLRLLESMPPELRDRVGTIADEKLVAEAIRRLRLLSMGAQSLLLSGGLPLDIDVLLGRGAAPAAAGKTRLSVIFINKLAGEKEKQFFVGQLAQALYRWMLKHPSAAPQALFYIDEVAPFLPPVRKPVCKDALDVLFRQARKYGIACLAATQSAGDLDYKTLGQISTWNLGRLVVQQELKKVETQLRALAPESADDIVRRLPALVPGQSILLAPDVFRTPVELQTRWLVTQHKTLDEKAIGSMTSSALRQQLEAVLKQQAAVLSSTEGEKPSDDASAVPVVGRAEVAVLAVDSNEMGTVGSCEIVVHRGGSGRITALGGQTKVSKESIKVAWEAASQLQVELELPRNFARHYDVTVLDTRLAVKKDGPSAGLAYLTGIIAAFRGKPPRPDLAMTGEITILGKVLAVGGIEQKVRAARDAGYATVVVPAENKSDLAKLTEDLRNSVEIVAVATVEEALPVIFATPKRAKPEPQVRPQTYSSAPPPAEVVPTAPTVPEAPDKQTERQGRICDLLLKESTALSAGDIATRLGEPVSAMTKILKQLVSDGTVNIAKRGRESVYYHAQHRFRPEYGLYGAVETARLVLLEPDARQRAQSQLASSMVVFTREEIVSQRLAYFPLYKVRFSTTIREGWIFKQEVERRDNLYFNALTAEVLSFQGNGFAFSTALPSNPLDVVDLDNLAKFETRQPGEIEIDDNEMKGLLKDKDIESSALRKFQLSVLEITPVFFPVWRFILRDKHNNTERELCVDGLKGEPIVLGAAPAGRKRR